MGYKQFWRTKLNTSAGTDSLRCAELRLLPVELLEPIADLFNKIKAGAEWPTTLQYAITAMLASKFGLLKSCTITAGGGRPLRASGRRTSRVSDEKSNIILLFEGNT